jgi:hypothetical protein
MSDLNTESSMKTEANHWYPEDRLVRLDRCRRFLFAEGIITGTVNEAVRKSLIDANELQLEAVRDALIPFALGEGDDPEDPEEDE